MKYSSPGPALLAAGLLFCTLFAPFGAYADNKKDELSAKQNQAQRAYNEAQQELEELQNQQSETQSQIDQLQGQSAEVAAQLSGIYTGPSRRPSAPWTSAPRPPSRPPRR